MSLNAKAMESARLKEEEMIGLIIGITKEIFSTFVAMKVSACFPLDKPVREFHCSLTGMVGMAGIYTGLLSIHCPALLAMKITSNMLGKEVVEMGEEVNDALGEIANIMGGHVKQVLSTGGLDLDLSIPTIISGETYSINIIDNDDCVVIPFQCDEEKFLVGISLRKEV